MTEEARGLGLMLGWAMVGGILALADVLDLPFWWRMGIGVWSGIGIAAGAARIAKARGSGDDTGGDGNGGKS